MSKFVDFEALETITGAMKNLAELMVEDAKVKNENGTLIYIVSGNVGSTIKQTIEERKRYWILPIYADG